jgi:hypothetical protein
MVSTNVFAEWTKIAPVNDNTVYIDIGSIKRKGNKVKVWYLYDFNTVRKFENYNYLSQVQHDEFDCKDTTSRMLDYYLYSGNKRSGGVVYSETNIKDVGISIMPDSILEGLFTIACGKK